MLVDSRTEMCNAVALNTGSAGSYLIGNQIDIGALRDLGQGHPIFLVLRVTTTATSGGNATGTFKLVSDDSAAISPTTSTVHFVSPTFPVASMIAGTTLAVIALPQEGNTYERFLGLLQVTGASAFTAGAIDAFLTLTPPVTKTYPDAVN